MSKQPKHPQWLGEYLHEQRIQNPQAQWGIVVKNLRNDKHYTMTAEAARQFYKAWRKEKQINNGSAEGNQQAEVGALRDKVKSLELQLGTSAYTHIERELQRVTKERDRNKSAGRVIMSMVEDQIERIRCKPVTFPAHKPSKDPATMLALFSDVHYGSSVKLDDTAGLGEYNIDICTERHRRHVSKLQFFQEKHTASDGLHDLIIVAMGDLLDGSMIYKGQRFHLENQSIVQQVFGFCDLWESSLLELAQRFHSITVFCVNGNHGRFGMKGDHHPLDNADYLTYRIMRERMAPQENITFWISESPSLVFNFGEYNIAVNHGDGIKSQLGVPYYGLSRRLGKLDNLYQIPIHHSFTGHIHTDGDIENNRAIQNGSYKGPDGFSVNTMWSGSRPSQRVGYIHPHGGLYAQTTIWLAPQRVIEFDDNHIGTPVFTGAA